MSTAMQIDGPAADGPLPPEVASYAASWLTRARAFPVFSLPWYRYRSQRWLALNVLSTAIVGISCSIDAASSWRGTTYSAASWALLVLIVSSLGASVAMLVRRRAWPRRKESIALVLAIVLGAVAADYASDGTGGLVKWLVFGDPGYHYVNEVSFNVNANVDEGSATRQAHQRPSRPENGGASTSTDGRSARPTIAPSGAAKAVRGTSERDRFIVPKVINETFSYVLLAWASGGFELIRFFRQRRRIEEAERQRELARAQAARNEAELKLSVLAAQVEPHFLFNTLAGVRSAITSDPARATAIVDHLADYLRATIPRLRQDGSSNQARLAAQLDAARAYLALMQARIPRLTFDFDVESGIDEVAVPPLMLISLVENAMKHGIEPKVGPGHVAVRACRVEGGIEVAVQDNGIGFGASAAGCGIGLANIRERLALLYGARASLSLKACEKGGVAAVIRLPSGEPTSE